MIYVFIFLGEFGYELLNWQGVVRKFSKIVNREDKIICCSRSGLNAFYECANLYIDISELPLFLNSVANGYKGVNPEINLIKFHELVMQKKKRAEIHSLKSWRYTYSNHKQIKNYVRQYLIKNKCIGEKIKFIFSDEFHYLKGLKFGRTIGDSGNIYAKLDLNNNLYKKIEANNEYVKVVEEKLGLQADEKFILCQLGNRKIVNKSKTTIGAENIINEIANKNKVVVLNFDTGRNYDSVSAFSGSENVILYRCDSFFEQSVLIKKALNCVFFTEGDFRSHNYVPPFMGKDVYSIASKTVYELPTTPIEFWNKNVFTFGGQIIPVISERLYGEQKYHDEFIERVTKD